jgi:general secretion pathway protein K
MVANPHSSRSSTREAEFEWLGRSGVELARYVLAQEGQGPAGQFDSLKQKWAGGPGESNSPVAGISMDNYELGSGNISVKIVDHERKFNINKVDANILYEALTLIGVDAGSFPTIVDSILDWRDPDDVPRENGAESAHYLNLLPAYFAKNGPFDELSELLWVQGVTPAIYYGSAGNQSDAVGTVGLIDLFTTTSGPLVNINTASANVLQVLPRRSSAVRAGALAPTVLKGPLTILHFGASRSWPAFRNLAAPRS